MNESAERSPLHSEWATASAADQSLAGTQSSCSKKARRRPSGALIARRSVVPRVLV